MTPHLAHHGLVHHGLARNALFFILIVCFAWPFQSWADLKSVDDYSDTASFEALLSDTYDLLERWRIEEAAENVEEAFKIARSPDHVAAAHLLAARVEFYEGSYSSALLNAEKALRQNPGASGISTFYKFLQKAEKTGSRFKTIKTDKLVFKFISPKDEVLFPYASIALHVAMGRVGADLGYYPSREVVVEVYPNLEDFAQATTLDLEDIKRTGVVGVCKFNRIMLLSPRLFPKGYPWLDTLTHEYIHYVVFKASGNTVPIWLHEGIAKYYEKRWREEIPKFFVPLTETILARAIKDDSLVTVEMMGSSFGKLPSAEQAGLAFVQVGSMVEFLIQNWGGNSIKRLVASSNQTQDFDVSFETLTGSPAAEFFELWREDLERKGLKESVAYPKFESIKDEANHNGDDEDSTGEGRLSEIELKKARNFARIGDLLRDRGRLASAVYEYRKANSLEPFSPIIINRLASSQNRMGMYEESQKLLQSFDEIYPGYVETYKNLGIAYMMTGGLTAAAKSFELALSLNPFDPSVHGSLEGIYRQMGLEEKMVAEKKALELLGRGETE